ncbi:MAG: hypothetical protein K2L03_06900, partial [Bacteroidales bacterium]|nr:hypothetical protein [Bacteroidales bacterium]
RYARADEQFTYETVDPMPGYSLLYLQTIDDQGLIFGYNGIEADPNTRKACVYTSDNGLVDLNNYLFEFYDITVPVELGCPTHTSADGKIIAGFFFFQGAAIPWYIELGEKILPRARYVKAKAPSIGAMVRIDWQKPYLTQAGTLTGYKIYRDDLNKQPIVELGPDAETYTDETPEEGQHTYYVVAVYGDEVAKPIASNAVQVLSAGSTFPVQKIDHLLQNNRYANIYWGLPSSEVVAATMAKADASAKDGRGIIDLAPVTTAMPKAMTRPASAPKYLSSAFDYIYNVDMQMYDGYAGIKVGNRYYVSSWQECNIRILNENNEIVGKWQPAGLNAPVLSMVYFEENQQIYCGTDDKVYVVDLKTNKVVDLALIPVWR